MHTLITGASGFVGSALLRRLLAEASPTETFTAVDIYQTPLADARIRSVLGKLSDGEVLEAALRQQPDRIYHLATIAGVGSATHFDLGLETNLVASMALLEGLRKQGRAPRLVYSSSVGTIGAPPDVLVHDDTLPQPPNSYGTHKLIVEMLINDYSRHQFIDGVAIRLPGIVARPAGSQTMLSAFLSNVFYAAKKHQAFELPMGPATRTWMMSLKVCLDNLIHAGSLPASSLPERRNWTLPVLLVQMQELVDALALHFGDSVKRCITYRASETVERMFNLAPISSAGAQRLGFKSDGDAVQLVRNVIDFNADLRTSDAPRSS